MPQLFGISNIFYNSKDVDIDINLALNLFKRSQYRRRWSFWQRVCKTTSRRVSDGEFIGFGQVRH